MPNSAPIERRQIAELNGLRGLAILMVFLYHYVAVSDGGSSGYRLASSIIRSSWCGVDLFFVLSGFLITGILLDTKADERYFINFFARRALRIFPLYFVTAVIVFVVLPALLDFTSSSDQTLLDNQGWVWCYMVNIKVALNGFYPFIGDKVYVHHLWSLAVEEQFYLVWPFIIYFSSLIALRNVCIACLVGALLLRVFLFCTSAPALASYTFTFCRIDALAAGSLLTLALRNCRERSPLYFGYWLVLPATILLMVLFVCRGGLRADDWPVRTVGYSLLSMTFSGLIGMALTLKEVHLLRKTLRWDAFQTLGKYSYGLYIIHVVMFPAFRAMLTTEDLQSRWTLPYLAAGGFRVMIVFAACMLLAHVSWVIVERYPLRLKQYF